MKRNLMKKTNSSRDEMEPDLLQREVSELTMEGDKENGVGSGGVRRRGSGDEFRGWVSPIMEI